MKQDVSKSEAHLVMLKQVIQNIMPVNQLMGIKIEKLREGYVEVRVPFKDDFVGDFKRGLWHGGILAAIADTTGGLVALSVAMPDDNVNTIDMRIDYLHGAVIEDVFVTGEMIKTGKRIVVVDVKIFQKHQETLVAVARCAYSILRK